MKRTKSIFKLLSLVISSVFLFALAFTFTACGEKEVDTPTPPAHTHTYADTWSSDESDHWHAATCEHAAEVKDKAEHTFNGNICSVCGYEKEIEAVVKCTCEPQCLLCPECGGCIDTFCEEEECIKCGDGLKSNEFEAEYAVHLDKDNNEAALDIVDRAGIPEKGDCVFVQGMAGAGGKKLIFRITSDKATTATLRVRCAKNGKLSKFTEQMMVVVNDEIFESEAQVKANKDPSEPAALETKRSFSYVNLGCIELVEGENVIEIIAFSSDPTVGLNMDKIDVMAANDITLTWEPIIRQGK